MDMEQLGTLHIFYFFQDTCQIIDIVSVNRTEIADIHSFEHILLLYEHGFQAVIETNQALSALFIQYAPFIEHF